MGTGWEETGLFCEMNGVGGSWIGLAGGLAALILFFWLSCFMDDLYRVIAGFLYIPVVVMVVVAVSDIVLDVWYSI